jgi:hydrogenase maturation protease
MRLRPGRLSSRSRHVSVDIQPYAQPAVALAWPAVQQGPARLPTVSMGGSAPQPPRVLVAAVGYRNLRDLSAGPLLLEQLRAMQWPPNVDVEDLSFGAIHVLHWLQECDHPFGAAVFVAGIRRGRPPGTVTRVEWRSPTISAEAVQERIAEAVTGVISLDTLLIVLGYFEALPQHVTLIEIEPRDEDWGPELSPPVRAALGKTSQLIQEEVHRLVA